MYKVLLKNDVSELENEQKKCSNAHLKLSSINDTFDGHVHTCISDAAASQTPREVCRAAAEAGLGHVCITDHDRILSAEQRRKLAEEFSPLDIISGCEFSASHTLSTGRSIIVHIIGLWLPDKDPSGAIDSVLKINQNQDFEGYCKKMLKKLLCIGIDPSGNGIDASYAMLLRDNPESYHIAKGAVAHLLVKTGYAKTVKEAKERYISAFGERLAYVSAADYCKYAPLEDVMKAANTGLSVLCHLYYYQLTNEENEELIETFKKYGGQALEVDYGHYTDERKAALAEYCRRYQLLPGAASDRHEPETPFKKGDPEMFRMLRERAAELHEMIDVK